MSRPLQVVLASIFFLGAVPGVSFGQSAAKTAAVGDVTSSAERAVNLAQSGHCNEALPLLERTMPRVTMKDLKRHVGLAGVRCAMLANQAAAAERFLQFLNEEFPHDPEILYVSVHTYSDLSSRAAAELATTAPKSAPGRELNAEIFEQQGKWDQAEKEYRLILEQNPQMPGIHFRLGRLLLSKPQPAAEVAEQARKEFEAELKIDPYNAGAEYVLGELARQDQNWDEAARRFARAAKLDSGFGDAYLGWGEALLNIKKFSEAIPPLEQAVKLEPGNPATHYNLALAYSRSGRKDDAKREFAIHRQLTEKEPTDQTQQPVNSQSPNP
jgi:tetratricopeptide (TPR) repeat protein